MEQVLGRVGLRRQPLVLRPVQIQHVDHAVSCVMRHRNMAVISPTGSGKGCEVFALAVRLLSLGQRVLIAAPALNIIASIVGKASKYDSIVYGPDSANVDPGVVRHVGTARVREFLVRPRIVLDRWVPTCTHQALIKLTDSLPEDLRGYVLALDEAQHAEAEAMRKFIDAWLDRGGLLTYYTATPYRADPKKIIRPDMEVEYLSLAEHMRSGDAPSRLVSEIVSCPVDQELTGKSFTGEELSKAQARAIARRMVAKWEADGRPKFIIYYPSRNSASSNAYLRKQLKVQFRKYGAKILDATGYGVDLEEILDRERNLPHSESEYDGVIGCGRVREGFDWPHCGAVYCVGMPTSPPLMVQLFGRSCRKKEEPVDGRRNPYAPSGRADVAEISFFVPTSGSKEDLKNIEKVHSWNTLAVCCFLADHEVGQRYVVLRAVKNGIRSALSQKKVQQIRPEARKEEEIAAEGAVARIGIELDSMAVDDVRKRSHLVSMLHIVEGELEKAGKPATNDLVSQGLLNKGIPKADVTEFVATILIGSKKKAEKKFEDEVRRNAIRGFSVDDSMRMAFETVLHDFRREAVDQTLLKAVGRHLAEVTGEAMQDFTRRLENVSFCSYDEAQAAAQAYNVAGPSDYKLRYKSISELSGIALPSSPDGCYLEFVDWATFLGREIRRASKDTDICPYETASLLVQKHGVRNQGDYAKRYKLISEQAGVYLPGSPPHTYSAVWEGWCSFFGKVPRYVTCSYVEARAAARKYGIRSETDYQARYKEVPGVKLPACPNEKWPEEWEGWWEFLGKGPNFCTYAEARRAVRKFKVRNGADYYARYKEIAAATGLSLPCAPHKNNTFPEWTCWADFLGHGPRPQKGFSTYSEVRRALRRAKVRDQKDYQARYKEIAAATGLVIPSHPQSTYSSEWRSWPEYLSRPRIRNCR